MTAIVRGVTLSARRVLVVGTIAIALFAMMAPSRANAQPVEYVKVCSLYGADFFYLPGSSDAGSTDVCVNVAENDAREATLNGTWRWRIPNNPRTWAQTSKLACPGGQVVNFGTLSGSSLTANSYGRFQTKTQYQLKLSAGQYVASVMYQGGFTIPTLTYTVATLPSCPAGTTLVTDAADDNCTPNGPAIGGGGTECEVSCVSGQWEYTGNVSGNTVGQGDFCMYYYYNDPINGPTYSFPLGCIDTTPQAGLPETLVFSPDSSTPPPTSSQVYILGANGDSWEIPSASSVQGSLSVSLCLQKGTP